MALTDERQEIVDFKPIQLGDLNGVMPELPGMSGLQGKKK